MITKEQLADPWWRITSGAIYKIIVKGDDSDDGLIVPFILNDVQLELMKSLLAVTLQQKIYAKNTTRFDILQSENLTTVWLFWFGHLAVNHAELSV